MSMGRYINLGNDGFRAICKGLYVDKSELISYINKTLGTKDKLTCVSRPRRFGKSFATQMLCAYYDKSCDSGYLFKNLDIAKDPSFEENLNKFDVIYLDITWFISTVNDIRNVVGYLQREVISELQEVFSEVQEMSDSLPVMLTNVTKVTGKKFIVLIDEWDALFREDKDNEYLHKEYLQLLRGLFKSSQTDKVIEAAYMTGILPIKKYGTQSALTDFREYTMLQPKKLAKYVGFTESEVRKLCDEFDMEFVEMKRWYDGYSFTKVKSVYSPDSVIEAVKSEEFGNYWTMSETYESLKIYIEMNQDGLKESIVQMLGGGKCSIDTGTFQNDMTSIKSRDDVLTLLVHLGYLSYDSVDRCVSIPNEEVRQEFIRVIKTGKYSEVAKLILESERLLRDTLSMDEEKVANAIEKAHNAATAPNFYNNEQALRSVIRFAYISCIDEFSEIQELPSGKGYADVVFLPKKMSALPTIVFELKWNKCAEGAIQQIKERNYPQVLKEHGSEILLVGVNYDEKTKKHTCLIEKYFEQ